MTITRRHDPRDLCAAWVLPGSRHGANLGACRGTSSWYGVTSGGWSDAWLLPTDDRPHVTRTRVARR